MPYIISETTYIRVTDHGRWQVRVLRYSDGREVVRRLWLGKH